MYLSINSVQQMRSLLPYLSVAIYFATILLHLARQLLQNNK